MTASQYSKLVVGSVSSTGHQPQLLFEIVDFKTLFKRRLGLIDLHDSEIKLQGGRFDRYREGITAYSVSFTIPFEVLKIGFTNAVNWVADNTTGLWSVDARFTHWGDIFTFSFDDATDGVLFRLGLNREVIQCPT